MSGNRDGTPPRRPVVERDEDAARLLGRIAAAVPVTPAPVGRVLDAAHRRRRRRLLTAAALLLLLAVLAAVL